MSAREELAETIRNGSMGTTEITDIILAAGYRKPKVIAYVVLDRDGQMIGKQFTDREAARAFAAEWTADCKAAGIDWDYRAAEIVEATP
jgi:hypothetical protein